MIKVLSLFDGLAGARQALKELNIDCDYGASEIDKFAIQVAKDNHEDIVHLGDVKQIYFPDIECLDLLIGGSPCQDLSIANQKNKGLDGERSGLFFQYLDALEICRPRFFILENVASMKKQNCDKISELLGVKPILINSALLTAQQRKRYYWVGKLVGDHYEQVEISQPDDQGITLKDILESEDTEKFKSYAITATYNKVSAGDYFLKSNRQLIFKNPTGLYDVKGCALRGRHLIEGKRKDVFNAPTQQRLEFRSDEKVNCLTSVNKDSLVAIKDMVRKLTPLECERLQGFPDGYCSSISKSQAYKALGNSFTVPIIKHILKSIYGEEK